MKEQTRSRDVSYSAYYRRNRKWVGPFGNFRSPTGRAAQNCVDNLKASHKHQVEIFKVARVSSNPE